MYNNRSYHCIYVNYLTRKIENKFNVSKYKLEKHYNGSFHFK